MDIHKILHTVATWVAKIDPLAANADKLAAWITALCVVLTAALLFLVLSKYVEPVIKKIAARTPSNIDDILLRQGFIEWVWYLISFEILQQWLPECLTGQFPVLANWLITILKIINIGLLTKLAVELLKSIFLIIFDNDKIDEAAQKIRTAYENDEDYDYIPSHNLKGLQQMLSIVIICLGVILMLATLLGKNPLIIISGLGAGAAVLMLVFKDSILGVVAGIQLTANDMLRPGDWIVAPAFGANGRVREVTLATVKVKNWDQTIITIPPYNLISGSFQNYRNMEEIGARRVARSLNIDMQTIHLVTEAEAKQYADEPWAAGIDWEKPISNLAVFRHYLEHYITNHIPTLCSNQLYMIRELQPTPYGLPVELYFFTSETSWARYERVQADVLDHVLAVVGNFGLKVYQAPMMAVPT